MATKVYLIPEIGFVQVPDSGTREYLIPEGGFFSEGAGSPDVEVTATCDSLTLTEYGATVVIGADVSVTATCDALTLTEYGATVNAEISFTATCDSLTLTENAATVTYTTRNAFDSDPACKALWRFESGALTTDSIGSNDLTNSGVAESTGTYFEGSCAADFEYNDNDYFVIADDDLDAGFPLKSGDTSKVISVAFWLKPESTKGGWVFCKGCDIDDNASFSIQCQYRSSGWVNLVIRNGYDSGTNIETWMPDYFAAGQVCHITVMHDGVNKTSTLRIYYSPSGTTRTYTVNWAHETSVTDASLAIGSRSDLASGMSFDGIVDEVVVFNRLLSVAEADAIRQGIFKFGSSVFASCDALTLTPFAATVDANSPINVSATLAELTLTVFGATVDVSVNVDVTATCDALTLTEFAATVKASVVVLANLDALTITTKYAVVSFDSKAVIETGWAKDRSLGPWEFNKPGKKYGYENNPRWVSKDKATTLHKPCGYWPLVYSEVGWYQQVVCVDSSLKIVGASMISQDNAQYKLMYLNYETDSIIKQVDFSTSERAVHTYYGATMMFDNADGVLRILYLNYEDALLRSYAYDYTGHMVDVTIATDMSTDFRTQGAYLGSGVVVAVNSDATNTYCYKSTDYGNSWSAGVTIINTFPVILAYDGVSRLYAAYTVFDDTQPFQMKYSTNGTTWTAMSGLPDAPAAQASTLLMTASGNNLMALYGVGDTDYLVISSNQGASWSASAFPEIAGDSAIHCDSIYLNGSLAFASAFGLDTGTHYILRSTDAGANWSVLPHPSYITTYNVGLLEKNAPIVWNHDDDAMVATFCGYAIYPGDLAFQISFDDGASWMQRSLHIGADNVDYGPNPVWTMPT